MLDLEQMKNLPDHKIVRIWLEGPAGSGKTSLLKEIVFALSSRGYQLAVSDNGDEFKVPESVSKPMNTPTEGRAVFIKTLRG